MNGTNSAAQVCVGVAYCFLASGVIFGFAALKPVLIEEGAYRQYCPEEPDGTVCYGQELRYAIPIAQHLNAADKIV